MDVVTGTGAAWQLGYTHGAQLPAAVAADIEGFWRRCGRSPGDRRR